MSTVSKAKLPVQRNRIRESFSRRLFLKINVLILLLISAVMLYPVLYVIAASLSEETAILKGEVVLWPVRTHVLAYAKVFRYPQLLTSYRNTMLIPGAVSTYNMILMRTFFMGIPVSLVEAAELDGCNDFGILIKIVLPLSMASLMTIGMFYAVSHWNSYFSAVLYLNKPELYPLQIILRQVVLQNEIVENASSSAESNMAEGIKYATIVVAMLPMLCVYPFIQRYFVKGVMIGSVKE